MWNKKPFVDSQIRNFDYIAAHLTPDAAAADSGKVLTVGADGKPGWANASGGGGGGSLLVTITDGVADKSYNDIQSAVTGGSIPYMIIEDDGNHKIAICANYNYDVDNEVYYVEFTYGINFYLLEADSADAPLTGSGG